eukprot:1150367-Pelagomonas_calceolata.AAC.1
MGEDRKGRLRVTTANTRREGVSNTLAGEGRRGVTYLLMHARANGKQMRALAGERRSVVHIPPFAIAGKQQACTSEQHWQQAADI